MFASEPVSSKPKKGYVLLTGGAGGIGRSVLKKLHEAGYRIICIDSNQQNIEEANALYPEVFYSRTDIVDVPTLLRTREALTKAIEEKEDFFLDHIVCLAGGALEKEWLPFEEQEVATIAQSIKVNLIGCINTIHTFLPLLKKSKSSNKSIVLISSINALGGFGLPGYSAAKAGQIAFMKTLAPDLGKHGIRINAISPGTVPTPKTEQEPKDFDSLLKTTMLGRFASTEDIANGIFFLFENQGITAENLVIDAGQTE